VIEIRFHGRGGQGAVVASELLAQAAFLEGKYPQSFPFFGVERRGAPVTAFTRIDDRPIAIRTNITTPDIVVVLDSGLRRAVDVTAGLKPDGLLLSNTELPPARAEGHYSVVLVSADEPPATIEVGFGGRVATVDATSIALAHGLGTRSTPIVNTAILGALARASEIVSIESVVKAIEQFVPAKPEANVRAAREAYDRVRVLEKVLA
jgi:2-oxoacid:acceptor oxidoreductase gamma subunit (pyruvate/2-ketoisovalerate family)